MLTGPPGKTVKGYQMSVESGMIPRLAAQNVFPLPRDRMKPPYDKRTSNEIHAGIPHFMITLPPRDWVRPAAGLYQRASK